MHGLIGPNGAGKTTAFNLISGMTPQTSGSVTLDGAALDSLPTWRRTARGLARTFQNIRMFREMSALENVMAGAHLRTQESLAAILFRFPNFRAQEKQAVEQAREILDFVGPPIRRTVLAATCPTATSGGSRSRVRSRPRRAC